MKKLAVLLMTGMIICSFTGCSAGDDSKSDSMEINIETDSKEDSSDASENMNANSQSEEDTQNTEPSEEPEEIVEEDTTGLCKYLTYDEEGNLIFKSQYGGYYTSMFSADGEPLENDADNAVEIRCEKIKAYDNFTGNKNSISDILENHVSTAEWMIEKSAKVEEYEDNDGQITFSINTPDNGLFVPSYNYYLVVPFEDGDIIKTNSDGNPYFLTVSLWDDSCTYTKAEAINYINEYVLK